MDYYILKNILIFQLPFSDHTIHWLGLWMILMLIESHVGFDHHSTTKVLSKVV